MKKLVKYQMIISLIILAVYWISSSLTKNPEFSATVGVVAVAVLLCGGSFLRRRSKVFFLSGSAVGSAALFAAAGSAAFLTALALVVLAALFALMVAWVAADELKIKKSFAIISIVIQIVLILAGFYGIQLIYS